MKIEDFYDVDDVEDGLNLDAWDEVDFKKVQHALAAKIPGLEMYCKITKNELHDFTCPEGFVTIAERLRKHNGIYLEDHLKDESSQVYYENQTFFDNYMAEKLNSGECYVGSNPEDDEDDDEYVLGLCEPVIKEEVIEKDTGYQDTIIETFLHEVEDELRYLDTRELSQVLKTNTNKVWQHQGR